MALQAVQKNAIRVAMADPSTSTEIINWSTTIATHSTSLTNYGTTLTALSSSNATLQSRAATCTITLGAPADTTVTATITLKDEAGAAIDEATGIRLLVVDAGATPAALLGAQVTAGAITGFVAGETTNAADWVTNAAGLAGVTYSYAAASTIAKLGVVLPNGVCVFSAGSMKFTA